MKLNELAPRPGSTKNRMRVGRGPGSGKGKTGGRGVKGQKSRSGVAIAGFEGGQMPLHMRMPKRGFRNPFAKKLVEVNLWRLAQAIDAGKLDASKPIDAAALLAAGVIRRERDGVRLLGEGEVAGKLDIRCHSATASARKAIEGAGGKLETKVGGEAADKLAAEKLEEKNAKLLARGKQPKGPRGKNAQRLLKEATGDSGQSGGKSAKAPKAKSEAAPAEAKSEDKGAEA